MSGRRIAIVIGVGKVNGMNLLDGARGDAERFCAWAEKDYHVYRFIDVRGRKVKSTELRTTIRQILAGEPGDPPIERILVYFSGHGTSLPMGDYWLLSDFAADGNECVNVELSMRTARDHPVGQLSFMADACRSSIPAGATVNGFNLFPTPDAAAMVAKQAKVDRFLATRTGTIAQEVPGADPAKAYGVFSQCLMTALDGQAPNSIDTTRAPAEVTSQKLAAWLEDSVPRESGLIPGGVVQRPDVMHGWASPHDWYARIVKGGKKSLAAKPPAKALTSAEKARLRTASKRREEAILARHRQIIATEGRKSFETAQGLTIVGAEVVDVIGKGKRNPWDMFRENDAWQVRSTGGPQSLAINLSDGRWIGAVALPEFIGTLLVTDAEVASLNYAVSRNSPHYLGSAEAALYTDAVARWSALAAAGRSAPAEEFVEFARRVRMGKHANPTLGIFAAYAYDRGRQANESGFDTVDSVARFFAQENRFVPFDVAFLSSTPLPPRGQSAPFGSTYKVPAVVAGGFPMMTRGWGLLEAGQPGIDRELLKLRNGLEPGLWTCFGPEAGAKFAALVRAGRV